MELTKTGKAKLKPFFTEIEILYSLRNRGCAEELEKLKVLKSKSDSSDHAIVFTFRKIGEGKDGKPKYVIKSIKFEKREPERPSKSESDSFI